jgi:hypothetical protein
MTISRAVATYYLTDTFSALYTSAGVTGYDWPIDQALRLLGTSEATLATATIAETDRLKYFAALDYYAAILAWRRLGDQGGSFQTGPHQEDGRGLLETAQTIMENAEKRCIALGLNVGGTVPAFAPTPVWIEPDSVTDWEKLAG